jgi:predicted outer membrane repeat protein
MPPVPFRGWSAANGGSNRKARSKTTKRRSWWVDHLEERRVLAALVVDIAVDDFIHSGTSLRDAVNTANIDARNGVSDTITFDPSLNGQTIKLVQGPLELGFGGAGGGVITIDGGNRITMDGNQAGRVFLIDANVQAAISGLTVLGGKANDGGALRNNGALTLRNMYFTGNSVINFGGSAVSNSAQLTIFNSAFYANAGSSGALDNISGAVATIANSTFTANNLTNSGVGAVRNGGTLTISSSTITGNGVGGFGAGGVQNNNGTLRLFNTIVAGNDSLNNNDIEGAVDPLSSHNLIGDPTGMTGIGNGTNGNLIGTSAVPADPKVTPFANFGGATSTTALLASSPAINNGGALTTLTGAISNAETTLTVVTAAAIASTPGNYVIQIDNEQLLVTAFAGNTLVVTRGYNGTTAASHALNAGVFFPFDQNGNARHGAVDIGAYESSTATFGNLVVQTAADGTSLGSLSLRDALARAVLDASQGVSDTITFAAALNGQTINLSFGEFHLRDGGGSGKITVDGAGRITLSGLNVGRLFEIESDVEATLAGLTLTGGNGDTGGAIYNRGALTLNNVTVTGNSLDDNSFGAVGAGAYNTGLLTVVDSTFDSNTADTGSNTGGAIYNFTSGTLVVSGSTFTNNTATSNGGAIYNANVMTVSSSTFSGSTGQFGGAVYNSGTATITTSTFTNNTATLNGGALYSSGGALTVTNSTISGNAAQSAGSGGGGIYSFSTALRIGHSTITGNSSASSSGGAGIGGSSTMLLMDSIVAGNLTGRDVSASVLNTSSNNLIGNGTGLFGISNGVNGNQIGTAAVPLNPNLGTLANNGGPTQTRALVLGSTARNTAGPLTTLATTVTATATSLPVAVAGIIAVTSGSYLIQVDGETMLVTNVNTTTNTLTVVRGQNGSTPVVHNAGAGVDLAADQRGRFHFGTPDIGAFEVQPATFSNVGGQVNYNPLGGNLVLSPGGTVIPGDLGVAVSQLVVTLGEASQSDNFTILDGNGVVAAGGSLTYNSVAIGSYSTAPGTSLTITFNGAATPAAVQAVFNRVAYFNSVLALGASTRTLGFQLTDAQGLASALYPMALHVNARPVLGNISGQMNYVPRTTATVVAGVATITAGDNGLANARLVVTLSSPNVNDRLTVATAGAVSVSSGNVFYAGLGLVAVATGGSGATPLTIQFNSAAGQAVVQAVLQNVVYSNADSTVASTTRTLTFDLADGQNVPAFSLVKTLFVNTAPILDATKSPLLATIAEDAAAPVGKVGTLIDGLIHLNGSLKNATDANAGAVTGIAVTGASALGTWYYSLNNGGIWTLLGVVANSGARLLAADGQTRIYFKPAADLNGTINGLLAFRAWDRTTGANGGFVSTLENGGPNAFSTVTDTASITITPVNDAPTLDASKSPTIGPVAHGNAVPVGAVGTLVSTIARNSGTLKNVADKDAAAQYGIAVFAASALGTWYYTTNNGASWHVIGSVGSGAARLLAADAGTRIYFKANASTRGPIAAAINFRAWDRTTGTNGGLGSVVANGGTTAYSAATDTASINVT